MSAERSFSTFEGTQPNEKPTGRRARSLIAEQAFLEGFIPLAEVKSPHENLRAEMHSRIIDQPEAIGQIIDAMDRSEVRLPNENKPIATFAFLGPSGVGKTEVARVLSEFLADEKPNLVKIDSSDYSYGHEIARLTGSPPGYVNSEQKAFLNKKRIEKKGTVIVIDEIEKGSPQFNNLWLQITDDGILQLNNGEEVSFRNAIIIMTSNLGAREMASQTDGRRTGFGSQVQKVDKSLLEKTATEAFKKHFLPEFINRIDKMVVFHPLSDDGLRTILKIQIEKASASYEAEKGIRLSLSEATQDHLLQIAKQGEGLGARPLIRALNAEIKSGFGRQIASGNLQAGTHVRVYHSGEVPEEYLSSEDQKFVYMAKTDPSIFRKFASSNVSPFMPPSSRPGTDLMPFNREGDRDEEFDDSNKDPDQFDDE